MNLLPPVPARTKMFHSVDFIPEKILFSEEVLKENVIFLNSAPVLTQESDEKVLLVSSRSILWRQSSKTLSTYSAMKTPYLPQDL